MDNISTWGITILVVYAIHTILNSVFRLGRGKEVAINLIIAVIGAAILMYSAQFTHIPVPVLR